MLIEVLVFANLLCTGILAGEEFVIRYGVRRPVASLDPEPHIRLRQALIRRLRVLVPIIFGLAFLSGIAVTVLERSSPWSGFLGAGVFSLIAFISITLAGTVPINQAVLTWEATAPPEGWHVVIERWELLDTARTWAALAAFGLFLGAALQH